MRRFAGPLLAGGLVVGVLAGGCAAPNESVGNPAGVQIQTTQDPSGYRGAVLDEPYAMPRLTFTDTSGRPFDLAKHPREPLTLVFFGYTNCPDVCSIVLAAVESALRGMDTRSREKIELIFITTDPRRDTPHVIREYLDRFDPGFTGLTGPMPKIKRAARQLGVSLTGTTKLPGGGYEVDHGAHVIAFDRNGRAPLLWTSGTPVGDLRHDFAKFLENAP
ncbi:MAG: SCO family protein [Carbonactinosporaceae bacterium]